MELSRLGDPQPEFVGPAWVVNSSLDQFIASVHAVTERFPFDSKRTGDFDLDEKLEDKWTREDRYDGERTQAGEDVLDSIRRIDPMAVADLNGFWHMFAADVQMGNYSIQDTYDPSGD